MQQVVDGVHRSSRLKDIGYAPKCRKNLISLDKAQVVGVGVMFEPSTTIMKAKYKDRVIMVRDSGATGIRELIGTEPVANGKFSVSFFNACEDDAMQLAHRCTCHTAINTLKIESTNAVRGLGVLKFTNKFGHICEACVDGKATNKPHPRR